MVSPANKVLPKKASQKFLVSACLAGIDCACDGKNRLDRAVRKLADTGRAIAVCPEVLGGLPIPRERYEITGGDGSDVLKKGARVISSSGKDVSKEFILGAKRTLYLAKRHMIKEAILKSKSPSCGYGRIYDGTFGYVLRKGDGVLASLLSQNGVRIYREGRGSYA